MSREKDSKHCQQRHRLFDRSFNGYLIAIFANAFNDNAFKLIVSLVLLRGISDERSPELLAVISAIFIVPFLLFSSWSGTLADRFSKRTVFLVMQAYEIVAMLIATAAFHFSSIELVLAALLWTGAQSAFYSPAKFGILAEGLPHGQLSRANGYLEAVTFVAIVLGTAYGGYSLKLLDRDPTLASLSCAGMAIIGLLAALPVWRVPSADPGTKTNWLNPFGSVFATLRRHLFTGRLGAPMVGLAFFWFLGLMVQLNILLLAKGTLFADLPENLVEDRTAILVTVMALGIGVGSILAGRWSGPKIELGLVPLGAVGTSLFLIDLGLNGHTPVRAGVPLFLLSAFSGLFVVPLQAAVQERAPDRERGSVLAASSFLTFLAMLGASGVLTFFGRIGMSSLQIFTALGVTMLVVAIGLFVWLADFLVRFLMWLLTHTIYRITIKGAENLPEDGRALLVSNHVSFVDALLIGACTQRFIRFLMLRDYYDNPFFGGICRLMKAIPIAQGSRDSVKDALTRAAQELRAGEAVCIFAEGAITRSGSLLPFRRGFETVASDAGHCAPIIPVHLGGVWGSIFSFKGGRVLWKWPRRIPYPVTVSFGPALPPDADAFAVRSAVMELSAEQMKDEARSLGALDRSFVRAARRGWFRLAALDSSGTRLSYGRLLAVSHLVAKRITSGEQYVGIALPASAAAAIANLAVALAGKIAVNLNFTAGKTSIDSAISSCGIRRVITSRKFREKVPFEMTGVEEIMMEDVMAKVGRAGIVAREIVFRLLPAPLLTAIVCRGRAEYGDAATVIFSSGSTGKPKGVVLTHGNIQADALGVAQVFETRPADRLVGALPFFHSFGYTVTFWFPLLSGFAVLYHANPMDAKVIAKLARDHRATFLLATPTFAAAYLRKIAAEDFANLRITAVGAEKLQPELAEEWEKKFGSPILEGYGATECSPVVAFNVPARNKPGSIGHPIPGVATRIVDAERGTALPPGEEGMLEVKGPIVMKEYLGDPERTAEVVKDGWYVTGDIARIDRDGYIRITGRLSRFSKIAGEMVPHGRVEEILLKASGTAGPVIAVMGVPDESKGERLVVLHAIDVDVESMTTALRSEGLPNLWIPRRDAYFRVDSMPLLGTGKLDLRGARRVAMELSGGAANDE